MPTAKTKYSKSHTRTDRGLQRASLRIWLIRRILTVSSPQKEIVTALRRPKRNCYSFTYGCSVTREYYLFDKFRTRTTGVYSVSGPKQCFPSEAGPQWTKQKLAMPSFLLHQDAFNSPTLVFICRFMYIVHHQMLCYIQEQAKQKTFVRHPAHLNQ